MPHRSAPSVRRRGRPPKPDGSTPDTRERLLEAAFASLLELGYDGATLADVAKRAGVTANAVYHHFDGRSALMVAAAKRALDAFVNNTTKALKKGDRVALVGFGTFSVSKRAARKGRNPQTGKEIKIAAKKVVKFKAGADLSKKVK